MTSLGFIFITYLAILSFFFLSDWIHPYKTLYSNSLGTSMDRHFLSTMRDQIASISWIIKTAREFQKNIYFCFIDYAKAFDCVDHNKLQKILREMEILDHLTCLLSNLYAGQEATVRTGHGTTDWFQIGKEYIKAVYCHSA